jgi:dipeptidyl aminopeptidase
MLTSDLELNNWLVNAFNGEWLKIADAKPKEWKSDSISRERRSLEVPSRLY